MNIFNSDEIEPADFEKASNALSKFVTSFEAVYEKKYRKYNVHLLLHIPRAVKDYGALRAWSSFPLKVLKEY